MESLTDLNSPWYSLRLPSRGHVHGFAPHIIGDARFPYHTGNRRAAMNADAQFQPATTERRTFVDHLKHSIQRRLGCSPASLMGRQRVSATRYLGRPEWRSSKGWGGGIGVCAVFSWI